MVFLDALFVFPQGLLKGYGGVLAADLAEPARQILCDLAAVYAAIILLHSCLLVRCAFLVLAGGEVGRVSCHAVLFPECHAGSNGIVLIRSVKLYASTRTFCYFPYGEQVVGTITAVDTFLGVILGISTATYNKTEKND